MSAVYFGIDPGSSHNALAIAGAMRNSRGLWIPIALRRWLPTPGAPLDIRKREGPAAARIVRALGGDTWATDSYAIDQIRLVGDEFGITTILATSDQDLHFRHARLVNARGGWALGAPTVPTFYADEHGDRRAYVDADDLTLLRRELSEVLRAPRGGGKWEIKIPTSTDGAHGDLAVAWCRALWLARAGDDVDDGPAQRDAPAGLPYRVDGARGRVTRRR